MRKTVPMRVGELWKDFVDSSPVVSRRLAEARVLSIWRATQEPMIVYYTEEVFAERGLLTIKMSSAAARSEVFMRREQIRQQMNRQLGREVIRTVIVK